MDLISVVRSLWPSGGALDGKYVGAIRDAVAETLAEAGDYLSRVYLGALPLETMSDDDKRAWAKELQLPELVPYTYADAECLERVLPTITPWRRTWDAPNATIAEGRPRIQAWISDMLGGMNDAITTDCGIYKCNEPQGLFFLGQSTCYVLGNGVVATLPNYTSLAGETNAYAGEDACQCGAYSTYYSEYETLPKANFWDATLNRYVGLVVVKLGGTYPLANRRWVEDVVLTAFPAGTHVAIDAYYN